jgi:glycosidase
MSQWFDDAFFYHLYPLGVCGAPWINPGGEPVPRINRLTDWIEPAARIGADAVLLGPIWESGTHGYDTHDYSVLDRRLGTNDDLKHVLSVWKNRGFRVVFDGVFNHCGRGFAPFADLVARGQESRFKDWFAGVDFLRTSSYGDRFFYESWNGHASLVKFNLSNKEVRAHLFDAVARWIEDYDLDGLRLDAADVIDLEFLRDLSAFCRGRRPDFWLMGEVIHGDYNVWAPGAGLDSVTNYELFKGLWSSHNDGNYFEAAWTLNRQFGPEGLYRGRRYYTFADNHDVDRLASTLTDPGFLYPHAILTATVPGIPSVYYGSEAGLEGKKKTNDEALRPFLLPRDLDSSVHQPLRDLWTRLSLLRRQIPALRSGDYRQALVTSRQFAFWRLPEGDGPPVLVAVNSDRGRALFQVELPSGIAQKSWMDLLNPGARFDSGDGKIAGEIDPFWGRILVPA